MFYCLQILYLDICFSIRQGILTEEMHNGYRIRRCQITFLASLSFLLWVSRRHNGAEKISLETASRNSVNGSYIGQTNSERFHNKYLITWYNLNPFISVRPKAMSCGFQQCRYNNCDISLNKQNTENSHAVIFDGRRVPEKYEFKRHNGQIWIFAEDETPFTYDLDGGYWKSEFWRHAFNWTMTYDRLTSDIYLPYGEIKKKQIPDTRDFTEIAKSKNRDALIITSHCNTKSRRLQYVKELQQYIDVDIIGSCGRIWKCGKQYVHNNCFEILNSTYRFYLAFENALCRGYQTEKFFDNFNYDIILVARGGISANDTIEPGDVYISTSNFPNVRSLGKYLNYLSKDINAYSKLLAKKSQYYSPGFHVSYQKSLCKLCGKMNHIENNQRQIYDLIENVQGMNPCKYLSNAK